MSNRLIFLALLVASGAPVLRGQTTVLPPRQPQVASIVPLTASIAIEHQMTASGGGAIDQKSSSNYFRDSMGRTRVESGTHVSIYDPVAGVLYSLNTQSLTATKIVLPTSRRVHVNAFGQPSEGNTIQPQAAAPQPIPLGTQTIEGFAASGQQTSTTIPAGSRFGNTTDLVKTAQVWAVDALKLPIMTVISDPINGTLTVQYTNVVVNPQIDPGLFQVPQGYAISAALPPRTATSMVGKYSPQR